MVKNGEIVAKGAVGTRVLDTDNAVTIDDRFHLGSDAKAMTATLVGMMVDEGKFKWTTTIGIWSVWPRVANQSGALAPWPARTPRALSGNCAST